MKKENDQKVNILANVHLQELDDFKQNNYVLTQNIDELEKMHKHKDQIKPDIFCEFPAPTNPPMEIQKCALCENIMITELSKHAYCHIAENLNPTDTTCQVCGHQCYDPKMLSRHNELPILLGVSVL